MKTAVAIRMHKEIGRNPLLCAIAAVTLLIAGCGGGGGSTSGGGSANPAPAVNLGASPNPVNPNGTATLTWSAPNATTCTASGDWNGPQPTSGSVLIPGITNDKVYTLTCTGSGGSGNGSVTVAINQPPVANNRCSSIQNGDMSVGVTLSGSDPNGNNTIASYTVPAAPSNGTIMECAAYPCTRSSPSFTYVPNIVSSLRGMDKFTFTVTDTGGLPSSTGTVTILNNSTFRVMPVGDSITQGVSGAGSCEADGNCPALSQRIGYRKKLYDSLEVQSTAWSVNYVGSAPLAGSALMPDSNSEARPGWCDGPGNPPSAWCTTSFGNVAANIASWLTTNPADAVLIHIGTNEFETSATEVGTILNNIASWESANHPVNVFIARIIPAKDGSLLVNTFNDNIGNQASGRPRVHVVDQQSGFESSLNDGNDALYADNLHPNQTGYDLMADKWLADMNASGIPPNCQ